MSEIELIIHRAIIVDLLAEVAAVQPDPREWLAKKAGRLARHAAETQRDGPAGIAEEAAALRASVSEITDAAADALAQILKDRASKP